MGFDAGSGNQEIVTQVFQDQAGVRVTGVSCQEAVPALARSPAQIPLWEAQPGCSRLVQAPWARYSRLPEVWLPAIPKAWTKSSPLRPSSRADTAAAPKVPQVRVG